MNIVGRVAKAVGEVVSTGSKIFPTVNKNIIKPVGGRIGDKIGDVLKGGIRGSNKVVKTVNKWIEEGKPQSIGKKSAYILGRTAGEIRNFGSGLNKAAARYTGGKEFKGLNKALNTYFNTDKFTGKKYLALLKKDDDALFFGYKATKLGTTVLVAGSAVSGIGGGVSEFNRQHMGVNTGTVSNAPINSYATMGNSYANNAGATGDLVFALNDQRKSGVL